MIYARTLVLKSFASVALIGVACALALTDVAGEPTAAHSPSKQELLEPMAVERLDNGMTFLIYPNRRAPIFSAVIRYDVGGKNERPGQTGIAHMFEHMAFKGTRQVGTIDWEAEKEALEAVEEAANEYDRMRERLAAQDLSPEAAAERLAPYEEAFEAAQARAAQYVVKDEFDQIYSREGGTAMNASTSADATTYYISLPANRLELWARMESERLSEPVMREFYSERDVVLEERRMRRDNSPVGRLWEVTMAAAYQAHPYRYPIIGWEADIRNLKAAQAREFFRRYYTPDRAVGVLVGDLDVEQTRQVLRQTFGRLSPAEDRDVPRTIVPEPEQTGERRVKLRLDATPTLLMAWHKPAPPDQADVAAEALIQVLTGGRSARWFEKFVKQERLASDIAAFTGPGDAEPNLFMIYAVPQGETTLDQLESAIRREIERLHNELIADAELETARKTLRADAVRALETNMGLARVLAEYTQIADNPYYLQQRLDQLQAVTVKDLQAFARQYLVDDNLTVGEFVPPDESVETAVQ